MAEASIAQPLPAYSSDSPENILDVLGIPRGISPALSDDTRSRTLSIISSARLDCSDRDTIIKTPSTDGSSVDGMSETRCVVCGKPAPNQCSGCFGAPAIDTDSFSSFSPSPSSSIAIAAAAAATLPTRTFYCSRDCQVGDLARHRPICRAMQARKALAQAAAFLQRLLCRVRRQAYPLDAVSAKLWQPGGGADPCPGAADDVERIVILHGPEEQLKKKRKNARKREKEKEKRQRNRSTASPAGPSTPAMQLLPSTPSAPTTPVTPFTPSTPITPTEPGSSTNPGSPDASRNKGQWRLVRNFRLKPFPQNAFSGLEDQDRLMAALLYQAGFDSMVLFHKLAEKLFQPLSVEAIGEIFVLPKQRARIVLPSPAVPIASIATAGIDPGTSAALSHPQLFQSVRQHHVYMVILNADHSCWAIDIAGAQFGHVEPMMPWLRYVKERATAIYPSRPFGNQRENWERRFASPTNVHKEPMDHIIAVVDDFIRKAVLSQNGKLSDLLKAGATNTLKTLLNELDIDLAAACQKTGFDQIEVDESGLGAAPVLQPPEDGVCTTPAFPTTVEGPATGPVTGSADTAASSAVPKSTSKSPAGTKFLHTPRSADKHVMAHEPKETKKAVGETASEQPKSKSKIETEIVKTDQPKSSETYREATPSIPDDTNTESPSKSTGKVKGPKLSGKSKKPKPTDKAEESKPASKTKDQGTVDKAHEPKPTGKCDELKSSKAVDTNKNTQQFETNGKEEEPKPGDKADLPKPTRRAEGPRPYETTTDSGHMDSVSNRGEHLSDTDSAKIVYTKDGLTKNLEKVLSGESSESSSSVFLPPYALPSQADQPYYTIQPIPRKGLGMVAVRPIDRGTRILAEPPLFTMPGTVEYSGTLKDMIEEKVHGLHETNTAACFFTLHNNFEGDTSLSTAVGISRSNMLPLETANNNAGGTGKSISCGAKSGIFLVAARINHSCLPNAQQTWNATRGTAGEMTVHVLSDVSAGEEICINYFFPHTTAVSVPFSDRRASLLRIYNFTCTCLLCTLPMQATLQVNSPVSLCQFPRSVQESDANLRQIARLYIPGVDLDLLGTEGDAFITSDPPIDMIVKPLACLHDTYKLICLLHIENIRDIRVSRAYAQALLITATHSDAARASVFARRALAVRTVLEGDDGPGTLAMKICLKRLISPKHGSGSRKGKETKNFKGNSWAAKTRIWRQPATKVPRNLSAEAMEQWLWKKPDAVVQREYG